MWNWGLLVAESREGEQGRTRQVVCRTGAKVSERKDSEPHRITRQIDSVRALHYNRPIPMVPGELRSGQGTENNISRLSNKPGSGYGAG